MLFTILKEMNTVLSLINNSKILISNKDKQVIETMVIDCQSNNLLSPKLKTKHAYVTETCQFSKLRYLEESLTKHSGIISVALKEARSQGVIQIVLGLQTIILETINEIESLTVTNNDLKPFILQEYPPLRDIIDKYRFVMSTCLLNLINVKKIESSKINLKDLKKLADQLN